MPGKAPVEHVGGQQDAGPWPSEVEEIAVDDRLTRPVVGPDGTEKEVEVTITGVDQITQRDGTPTDGYAVAYQFDGGLF